MECFAPTDELKGIRRCKPDEVNIANSLLQRLQINGQWMKDDLSSLDP